MNQYEFILLPIDEQADYVWQHGSYLLTREGQNEVVKLYSVDTFFAEIWYDRKKSTIKDITCFGRLQRLDAYLQDISLPELLG